MDEQAFRRVAAEALDRVRATLDKEDPDVVECVVDAGVLKIQFPRATAWVLNLQPPVSELWLAADRHAWHFKLEPTTDGERWLDKKSRAELFATLRELLTAKIGKPVF